MRNETARQTIVNRLREDLIGPNAPDEELDDLPSDRYLTGILFPLRTVVGADQGDEADTAEDDGETGGAPENIPAASAYRPSSAGLSFAVEPDEDGVAGVIITIKAACYERVSSKNASELAGGEKNRWRRYPVQAEFEEVLLPVDCAPRPLDAAGIPGMKLHLRVKEWNGKFLVTAAISNSNEPTEIRNRLEAEERTFFQVSMKISPAIGTSIVEKPASSLSNDRDKERQSNALIYRDAAEYAVGHTCSAGWNEKGDQVESVSTRWIPEVIVQTAKASGDEIFDTLSTDPEKSPLNTKWLSEVDEKALISGLNKIALQYNEWISIRIRESESLPAEHTEAARKNIEACQEACDRIKDGIELLSKDNFARTAFQLANRAMWLQNSWKAKRDNNDVHDLVWRPFQLAFVLLTLCSASDGKDKHRETMDLLWFPTGGGKTEAYLLLTAYVIFLRRLRAKGNVVGAGVTVFMRYTLRLLTIQQFQRASALICACELLRKGIASSGVAALPSHFKSDQNISIGLWVGNEAVPNKVTDAIESLEPGSSSTPNQLPKCPVCNCELHWRPSDDKTSIEVRCHNKDCDFGKCLDPMPIWTVDDDIYRALPSLMIGTADKYAQLPRNASTGRLFGYGTNMAPPDLIIQDELHLISGPLGTLAGIYEIAVDELCSRDRIFPKIIGSTATIRRADKQIRALFNRNAFQFPPAGLDHGNSGFATLDKKDPGRLYVGITTTGRSAKFALQAVTASLMQSAFSPDIKDDLRDAYWTLVAYFNSLRELGGALVLMRDDVERSIDEYATRRQEKPREIQPPIELTSRVSSSEIPEMLEQLDIAYESEDCVDTVLASNMISVGVDVSRLGLMVVNGQPKGIAEYIQATSRVGRSKFPGLVVTVFNANKTRDRSRYETFTNWHQSLYRDVEATSVTPFAPRARDRALHAALVAIVRHLVPGMNVEPVDAGPHEGEIREVINRIVERASDIDSFEANATRQSLEQFLEKWISRGSLKNYWDDWGDNGLLMSAEAAAERAVSQQSTRGAKSTPNSLRSVEPSTAFVIRSEEYERKIDR